MNIGHSRPAPWALGMSLVAGFRRLTQSPARRIPRLDSDGLSDEMKRDLGFADGRLAPPRDPLRD